MNWRNSTSIRSSASRLRNLRSLLSSSAFLTAALIGRSRSSSSLEVAGGDLLVELGAQGVDERGAPRLDHAVAGPVLLPGDGDEAEAGQVARRLRLPAEGEREGRVEPGDGAQAGREAADAVGGCAAACPRGCCCRASGLLWLPEVETTVGLAAPRALPSSRLKSGSAAAVTVETSTPSPSTLTKAVQRKGSSRLPASWARWRISSSRRTSTSSCSKRARRVAPGPLDPVEDAAAEGSGC